MLMSLMKPVVDNEQKVEKFLFSVRHIIKNHKLKTRNLVTCLTI